MEDRTPVAAEVKDDACYLLGHNMAGYLPEADPYVVRGTQAARQALREELSWLAGAMADIDASPDDIQTLVDVEAAVADLDGFSDPAPQSLSYMFGYRSGRLHYWLELTTREVLETDGWTFDAAGEPSGF